MDRKLQIAEKEAEKMPVMLFVGVGNHGCVFVNFQDLYERFLKIRHSSCIAWDRVHPNQMGATLMTREFFIKVRF